MAKVLVSAKGRRFHVNDTCPGYQQGINNSEKLGRQVHPPELLQQSEAERRGFSPCHFCRVPA